MPEPEISTSEQCSNSSAAAASQQSSQAEESCTLDSGSKEKSTQHIAAHACAEADSQEGSTSSTCSSNFIHSMSQPAESNVQCIHGINQVVLVLQPDDSTQYMLLSEERALRAAAAKQAAHKAEEQGLVPADPRDAAIMQAIEDGDTAVRRVFQERMQAASQRHSSDSPDAHMQFPDVHVQFPAESRCDRSQEVEAHVRSEAAWLARLQAADLALTAELNSRDAALSTRI